MGVSENQRGGDLLAASQRFERKPGIFARLLAPGFHKLLDKMDEGIARGAVLGRLPDGSTRLLGGRAPGFEAEVTIHDWRALVRVATGGSVGWYQAWEAGEWSSPDPVPLFALFMQNALTLGDPMDEATDVGPLATESGRADVAELVDDAVAKGAQVLTGGSAPDHPGWYYPPTVLAGLNDDMRIVMEETFGPVASVYKVADREEAVRTANQTTFGLSSSVWSNDAAEQDWFVANLDAGAVFLNGMTVSYPELPFGGVKDSGYGRELAAAGIREFCNLKTVWKA